MSELPATQTVLLLHGPKQTYAVTHDYSVPLLQNDSEILVRNRAIGLNPIDWKAPDFNFGLPQLPYIAGRELAGTIAKVSSKTSRWKLNDRVAVISTDYRDLRKAAYQEYVVAQTHTVIRLPDHISFEAGSTFGVAFVAASLALGVSLGVDFSNILDGPDLYQRVRDMDTSHLPEDVRTECLHGIRPDERPQQGDWLAIWGGSATSAHLTIQIAKLAGLKIAVVADCAKHGLRLSNHDIIRPDLLVDMHDPQRAIDVLRENTKGRLRYGLDTRGRESAGFLLEALRGEKSRCGGPVTLLSPPTSPSQDHAARRHLVGLTGLPRGYEGDDVFLHTVPMKVFHEVESMGQSLTGWAERLLEEKVLLPPDIVDVEYGLGNVNAGLDRMRRGEISGGKLVVKV